MTGQGGDLEISDDIRYFLKPAHIFYASIVHKMIHYNGKR
jgi:hypothetical protein